MPAERLKILLKDLQSELDNTKNIDPETASRLRSAAEEISAGLANQTTPNSEEPQTIFDEILEADQRFEIAHPRISSTLRQILATLSNMGI